MWPMFKDHHYLDSNLAKASRCYVAVWDGKVVGFCATMALPNPYFKGGWRSHRTIILPDYQGMGMGVRFSNTVGDIHLEQGHRYFSRTAHPRMGGYRDRSELWKATSKNRKKRTDEKHQHVFNNHYVDNKRICFSHEYIGKNLHI